MHDREHLQKILVLVKSARVPILVALLISGWLALIDSLLRGCVSFIFFGAAANLVNFNVYTSTKAIFGDNKAKLRHHEKFFRHWEVATGGIYILVCEYMLNWHSALDRDIFCFHLPTFYGVVVAETYCEAIVYLAVHAVLISPMLLNVHYSFGYLQHSCMLVAAAWMKQKLANIAARGLDLLDEHEKLQNNYCTRSSECAAQEKALLSKSKEYEEMSRLAEEVVGLLTQRSEIAWRGEDIKAVARISRTSPAEAELFCKASELRKL
eukprot:CAMPEP_0115506660 /NCGR_PEP_ID=MMETSP0271-20121206/71288_1 /TAXON_ID=71861 /ORGANISM="Scrippsiella trochoidea, Strain CCMP3099" /LENGTH=265 /DNA_ID=CAMNT_0002936153 /DNA_START=45 /DNA_END=842 /DNA_ORIENTATION=-